MAATKGNGLDAPHDQPAKFNKFTADFIARLSRFATADMGYMVLCVVMLLQAVLMALPGIFQMVDWAGLVALGGVTGTPGKFAGTANPRHLRAIQALLVRPQTRQQIDEAAGAANGPDLISNLRDLFPASTDRNEYIACDRIKFIDRDGKPCRPGVYSLMGKARRLIIQWISKRNSEGAKNA